MLYNFWRKLHLTLALVVGVFLIIASVTGAILSFEPIEQQSHSYYVDRPEDISVVDLIKTLDSTYADVDFVEGEMNESGFFQLTIIDEEGEMHKFFIDPRTGKKLGTVTKPSPTFDWNRKLHRSLFLGSTGRMTMGIVAAILLLMAITGIALVLKRQLKLWKYFGKITRNGTFSYLHIALGRWAFPLLMIVSITGTYLSLHRFGYLPKENKVFHKVDFENLADSPEIEKYQFRVFKKTSLDQVQKIQFPFTPFPEDYYQLRLKDRDIIVNQYTGNVESTEHLGETKAWNEWIFNLHTGRGSIGWSLVLLFASISMLFFIISGFSMSIKRLRSRTRNQISADNAEVILLYGSESGQTGNFVQHIQNLLIQNEVSVYVDQLNNYKTFAKMRHLVVLTSTYGNGEAPSNARLFIEKYKGITQPQEFDFSVVGFGSSDYPDFCKFAEDVRTVLSAKGNSNERLPMARINKQSKAQKEEWLKDFLNSFDIRLGADEITQAVQTSEFEVIAITEPTEVTNQHFRLELKAPTNHFQSGDLLAILPDGKDEERFYSIGKLNPSSISLSIRKHDQGLCSGYLSRLKPGDIIDARIQSNPDFHFQKQAPYSYFIANGTGIAPLLGMLAENDLESETFLLWGMKNRAISDLYLKELETYHDSDKLSISSFVFSQEKGYPKSYVQDAIKAGGATISQILKSGGVIYICGSTAMHDAVLAEIAKIIAEHSQSTIKKYLDRGQILTDCY